ncbi:MAG: glycosyltransferase [Desulfatitalea sp.]|nr:glycosyltransferase [Desulfatitalea sp.]
MGIGSYGDVYPLVGLGRALKNRRHQVTFLANAYFERIACDAGLTFGAIGTVKEYEQFSATIQSSPADQRRLRSPVPATDAAGLH